MRNLAEDRKEAAIEELERQRAMLLAIAYAVQNPAEAAKLYTRYNRTIEQLRSGEPVTGAPPESSTARILHDPFLSGLLTRVVKQREDKRRQRLDAARKEHHERRR